MSTATPDYSSPDFDKFKTKWMKVDACLGGTEAMRRLVTPQRDSIYLPQFPLENDEVYRRRIEMSTFYPAYSDTLDGIVGTILRKPIRLGDNVTPPIARDAENIDNAGTHFEVFAHRLLRTSIHYGAAYVLVDMGKRPDGVLDAAQASAINFRPFWLLYSARELANWPRYVVINGAPTLQQIVFREQASVPDGFGERLLNRYRVWRLPVEQRPNGEYYRAGNAQWEIWEEQEPTKRRRASAKLTQKLALIDSGNSPLSDIPVAVLNANPSLDDSRTSEGPVLLDLANLNIKLYQMESDHENNLHLCTPIPYSVNLRTENGMQESFAWGAGLMFHTDAGGGISYAEPSGSGLAERRAWMLGIREQLLDMGLSLAVEGSQKAGMTATESMLRAGRRASRLTQIARAFQDCFEQALYFHARWKGEQDGGEISLGVRDSDLVLSPQDIGVYSQLQEKGQISLQTLWAMMQRGGLLPDEFDSETEGSRLTFAG